jgi:hypothetical protein
VEFHWLDDGYIEAFPEPEDTVTLLVCTPHRVGPPWIWSATQVEQSRLWNEHRKSRHVQNIRCKVLFSKGVTDLIALHCCHGGETIGRVRGGKSECVLGVEEKRRCRSFGADCRIDHWEHRDFPWSCALLLDSRQIWHHIITITATDSPTSLEMMRQYLLVYMAYGLIVESLSNTFNFTHLRKQHLSTLSIHWLHTGRGRIARHWHGTKQSPWHCRPLESSSGLLILS